MDRQENKAQFDYQNFINYNQSQWPQNGGFMNPLYVNNQDPSQCGPNNSIRQMVGSIPQPNANGMDYYQCNMYPNTPFKSNYSNFNIDPKLSYKQIPYPYEENFTRDHNTGGGQRSGPLRTWLNTHLRDPYPSSQEKQKLSQECNKTYVQVCTWFANARRSLRRQGSLGVRVRRSKGYEENYEATNSVSGTNMMLNTDHTIYGQSSNLVRDNSATATLPLTSSSQNISVNLPSRSNNNK